MTVQGVKKQQPDEMSHRGRARGQKKVYVPKINLQVRAPLINFTFILENKFLMWLGGWVSQKWGGGVKSLCSRLQAVGRASPVRISSRPTVVQPTTDLGFGVRVPAGRLSSAPAPHWADGGSNRRPAGLHSAALGWWVSQNPRLGGGGRGNLNPPPLPQYH